MVGRPKNELLGEKLGYITIVGERKLRGVRKLTLKCDICESEKEIWYSQYNSGNWYVCEHDAL